MVQSKLARRRMLELIILGSLASTLILGQAAAAQQGPQGPQPVKVVNMPGPLALFGAVAGGAFVGVLVANLLWKVWQGDSSTSSRETDQPPRPEANPQQRSRQPQRQSQGNVGTADQSRSNQQQR